MPDHHVPCDAGQVLGFPGVKLCSSIQLVSWYLLQSVILGVNFINGEIIHKPCLLLPDCYCEWKEIGNSTVLFMNPCKTEHIPVLTETSCGTACPSPGNWAQDSPKPLDLPGVQVCHALPSPEPLSVIHQQGQLPNSEFHLSLSGEAAFLVAQISPIPPCN